VIKAGRSHSSKTADNHVARNLRRAAIMQRNVK